MTWKFFELRNSKGPAQVLLDQQFAGASPVEALPRLAWFGVWCQQDPGGACWNPGETAALEALEEDLLKLVGQFGNGWAVYVRRHATPGLREYYLYFGEGADLARVAQTFKANHPEYRIEYEATNDPKWSGYASWLKEAPLG